MIPQDVYDHIKYGNGAIPGADMERGRHSYSLSPRFYRGRWFVICTKYTHDDDGVLMAWRDIPLRDVPESDAADWRTYWTGEA